MWRNQKVSAYTCVPDAVSLNICLEVIGVMSGFLLVQQETAPGVLSGVEDGSPMFKCCLSLSYN